MTKPTKPKVTLKPIITLFSTLALCCSTLSYADYDKTKDAIPGFYWLGGESKAIAFDKAILRDSHYFATNLALRSYAKNVYRTLHDVKQHHFQRQQIALMQDVLSELKAINQTLANQSERSQKEAEQLKLQKFVEEMNKYQMHDSYSSVYIGNRNFNFDSKEALVKMYKPASPEVSERIAKDKNNK